jgi:lipopolysaccharide export system protein LptC
MNGGGLQHARNFWLPLVIIGGLVVLTAWLGQLAQAPVPHGNGVIGHDPDYFVEDFKATAFDISGQPRYRLSAIRMTHFMDDDTTTLEAPRFVREGVGLARVVARSLQGLVSAQGDNVYLFGDVRMIQERQVGGPPLELATEYLWVQPEVDLVRTDKPVVLKEGTSELSGESMVADGRQRTLVLKGRVKGIYENRH